MRKKMFWELNFEIYICKLLGWWWLLKLVHHAKVSHYIVYFNKLFKDNNKTNIYIYIYKYIYEYVFVMFYSIYLRLGMITIYTEMTESEIRQM